MAKLKIEELTDLPALKRMLEQAAGGKRKDIDPDALLAHLRSRIRGQDQALGQITDAVFSGYAKQERRSPVATFLLVGPPGTGKTETAKALSEYIFGSEGDLLTINGAEHKNPSEGLSKLIGVGAAYQGTDQGGMLTRPMFSRKERVVLFDEVEKMSAECYDLFLTMLQDGYVTEQGKGRKADFTSAVVIMTSNLDHDRCREIAEAEADPEARTRAFKEHFNARGFARPEILDRIPDIVYYRSLPPEVLAEVATMKIASLIQQYRLRPVHIDHAATFELVMAVLKGNGGIRDLQQTAERRIGKDLAELAKQGVGAVRVVLIDQRMRAVADAGRDPPA